MIRFGIVLDFPSREERLVRRMEAKHVLEEAKQRRLLAYTAKHPRLAGMGWVPGYRLIFLACYLGAVALVFTLIPWKNAKESERHQRKVEAAAKAKIEPAPNNRHWSTTAVPGTTVQQSPSR